ncbi:MAG: hypothetical protein KDK07_06455 [Bauldia sp.]|nr:hypothetical protein [Bauldia sp.]
MTVELDNRHPVPVNWDSQDPSTGYARVLIDTATQQILKMELVVDSIFLDGADNVLDTNPVQPFHFHNLPQGGPNFIVEQLFDRDPTSGDITTATLEQTDTGFAFTIDEPYTLRPPVNNPGLGVQFVLDEILAGNGYLGVHTNNEPIPQTAIAGDMIALGGNPINGRIVWAGDDRDVTHGGRRNDLLSLGGGNDRAKGGSGNDILDGGAGDDDLSGDRGGDSLWGGDGDDVADGGAGNDQLWGNRGNDRLEGDCGDDDLSGGLGNDLLIGGFGNDTLAGGDGGDTFRFGRLSGDDTISDFNPGEDTIVFTGRQRVVDAALADLDGDGYADDTLLTVIGGSISVIGVDLTADYGFHA